MRKANILFLLVSICVCLCACSKDVTDKKIKIKIDNNSYEAIYSGCLENGKPSGSGKVTISDYIITFDGKNLIGKYEGESESGIPEGNGSFSSTTDDYTFEYNGEWKSGTIKGIGNLKYDKYIVHYNDLDREGKYVGDTLDGAASGYGKFTAQNDYGETYTHEGAWENGLSEGYGRRVFEESDIRYVGIFTEGEFDYTLVNILYTMTDYDGDLSFDLSEEEVEFINDNSFMFPCKELSTLAMYVDEDLTYIMIEKNESAYNDSLMIIDPAYVISIDEYDVFEDNKLSMLLLEDNDDNVHYVIYPSEAKDIYSGDYVGCVGYPIGFSSYENMGGNRTKCTILLGSYITK